MRKHTESSHHLELRVHDLAQLFNFMDPTPFHSKALDGEAEAYIEAFIEAWARGFTPKSPLHLAIHLQHMPSEGAPTTLVTGAIDSPSFLRQSEPGAPRFAPSPGRLDR